MANLKWLPFLFFVLACGVDQTLVLQEGKVEGGVTIPDPNQKDPGNSDPEKVFLAGAVSQIDGKTVELASLQEKPLILMFAGFLCSTCAEEVKEIRAALSDPNSPPEHVQFLSVVVGEDESTAQFWKQLRNVTWNVGYDERLELFTQYCGAGAATPCTLIQTPEGGLVYKHIGKTPVSTMMDFTGNWEK